MPNRTVSVGLRGEFAQFIASTKQADREVVALTSSLRALNSTVISVSAALAAAGAPLSALSGATARAEAALTGLGASSDRAAAQVEALSVAAASAETSVVTLSGEARLAAASLSTLSGTTDVLDGSMAALVTQVSVTDRSLVALEGASTAATGGLVTMTTALSAAEGAALAVTATFTALAVESRALTATTAAAAEVMGDLAGVVAGANVGLGRFVATLAGADAAVGDFAGVMALATTRVQAFNAALGGSTPAIIAATRAAAGLRQLGTQAGTLFVGLAGISVFANAQFEHSISEVGAVSDLTAGQLDDMRRAALQAGADTKFSAKEAADAEGELAKAGISAGDVLSGGLLGSLNLAAAGQYSLANSAEVAANAMTIWKMQGKDIPHIADVLSAGAAKSSTDVKHLSDSMRMGGLVASQMGLSFEQTIGVLSMFAQAGLKGSDAGTSLKTMLMHLMAPTTKSTNLMKSLGIAAYDASGSFVGIEELAGQLASQLGTLSEAQRNYALSVMFGQDGIRAAKILMDNSAAGVRQWTSDVNDSGNAVRHATTLQDNLSGSMEKFGGSVATNFIVAGDNMGKALRHVTDGMTKQANVYGAMNDVAEQSIAWTMGVVGAISLLGVGLGFLVPKIKAANASLATMGATGRWTSVGLARMTPILGKTLLAIAAFQIASASIGTDLSPQIGQLAKDLRDFASSGQAAGEMARLFEKDLGALKYDLGTLDTAMLARWGNNVEGVFEGITGLGSVMDNSAYHAKQRLGALDAALSELANKGGAKEAEEAFNRIYKIGQEKGVSREELLKGLPAYKAILEGATATVVASTQAIERQKVAVASMAGTLEQAINATGGFEKAWNSLHGSLLASFDTEIAAEEALDAFTDSIKENGNSLDIHEAKGRANAKALRDGIVAAKDHAEEMFQSGKTTEEVAAKYNGYIENLRQAAYAAGMDKAEVDKLIATLGTMPKSNTVDMRITGVDAAMQKIVDYKRDLERIDGLSINTYIVQNVVTGEQRKIVQSRRFERWGGYVEHAALGLMNAGVYPSGRQPLYGFAEQGTGGEAFIPRYGNQARSRGIAEHVVRSWLGGEVSWGSNAGRGAGGGGYPVWSGGMRGSPGGGGVAKIEVVLRGEGTAVDTMMQLLRTEIRTRSGGDVQVALGRS